MHSSVSRLRLAIGTTILLGTASFAAMANQVPLLLSGPATPLCYCHCAYESGKTHCTKMCELPQYQNRWWAVSCHKKSSSANESSSPAPNNGSRKTNRHEDAQL
jgi:hypothetical protein